MTDKNVLVIGGGVAGLSAAIELARLGVRVDLVEKSNFPGGHAIQFACKAADKCVKCGACAAEEKLRDALEHQNIRLLAGAQVQNLSKNNGKFSATVQKKPAYIDPKKCTDCGLCFDKCPSGAILRGFSKSHSPFYSLCEEKCLYVKDKSCRLCEDICPESAICLDKPGESYRCDPDAVVVATGFTPFNPKNKPYGYKVLKNVITNLELERMLRAESRAIRPSDNTEPKRIAFIQCVGSRDAQLGHLWCSKICCGSALRMARLIKTRQPETEITFFYMDVQTFGKDFKVFYESVQKDIRMIRAIPGDIFKTENESLRVTFLNPPTHETMDEYFDMAVLSVAITPCSDNKSLAELTGLEIADSGFFDSAGAKSGQGIFTAGTAQRPMSIAESIASAGEAAWKTMRYLEFRNEK